MGCRVTSCQLGPSSLVSIWPNITFFHVSFFITFFHFLILVSNEL